MFLSRPLFRFPFGPFKLQYKFYNKYMWKMLHLLCSAGIQTHDLLDMCLPPIQLEQGSRKICFLTKSLRISIVSIFGTVNDRIALIYLGTWTSLLG